MITSDRINDTQPQICPLDIWKHCLKKFNVFHHDFFETKLFHADSKKPYSTSNRTNLPSMPCISNELVNCHN